MAYDPVDEVTRSGMVALLARWNLNFQEGQYQTRIRDEAAAKAAEALKVVASCKTACLAFGFDRDNSENWERAVALFGKEANDLYNRVKAPYHPVNIFNADGSQTENPVEVPVAATAAMAAPVGERPSIRTIVLQRLEEAGDGGLKASNIREYIEKAYPDESEIHDKTVGMTLYRLLKAGLVRRDKHNWFIVTADGGTKNPGGETPGLNETGN